MIRTAVFVDTGAWLALSDKNDQYHESATAHIRTLIREQSNLVTSNLVIHETIVLLSRRVSQKAALSFLDTVYNHEYLTIIHSDALIEQEAYEILRKYADHDLTVADCVSFVIMKREDLKRAFTFDKHFKTLRFAVEP